jgi:hypothetical protein
MTMVFRDLFVLFFGLAAAAGFLAVVSATVQQLFSRVLPGDAGASAVGSTLTSDPVVPEPAPRVNPALVGPPPGVFRHPAAVVTPGGVCAGSQKDLDEALLDEALLRQGIDPVDFRRARLEAAIARFSGSADEKAETQPQDVEFWEVESGPRHDPTA